MKKLLISIFIGVCAGVIDVIPMVIQKLNIYADISAFIQWVVLGVFINYIDFKINNTLKGLIVAVMASLPIMVIVYGSDHFSVIPIIIMSILLGSLVGFFGGKFAKE
jgi:hypothetical protein